MKKYCVVLIVLMFIVCGCAEQSSREILTKARDDQAALFLADYEKENYKLKLLADRRELQFKIATYESKLNLRVAKPVKNRPTAPPTMAETVKPVDPNK